MGIEYYIYVVRHPKTLHPKYVGKTKRMRRITHEHTGSLDNANFGLVQMWEYVTYEITGKPPVVEILETTDRRHSREKEAEWIQKFISDGYDLLNEHTRAGKAMSYS